MRRIVLIAIVVLSAAGVAYAGLQLRDRANPDGAEGIEVTVERGDIVATVSGPGEVAPKREQILRFKIAGRVAQVHVSEGDHVEVGSTVATLQSEELALQVAQSEAGLETARARLAQLQQGPSADEIAVAEAQLELARISLQQAQSAYDRVAWMPNIGMLPQSLALQQAHLEFEQAQASYRLATEGTSAGDLRVAQAEVDRAQAALDSALLQLEGAALTAPFSGVVAEVWVQEGELVSNATSVLVLLDLSEYHIDLELDEIDIAQVEMGQPARITLDALPDQPLTGEVSFIAPQATVAGGIVTYRVRVELDPTSSPLRAGMTAHSAIETQRKSGVLLVPNRAIQVDRVTGRTFVERLIQDGTEMVEVQIGLQDETHSEVEGVSEGDEIAIRSTSSLELLRQAFGGPGT